MKGKKSYKTISRSGRHLSICKDAIGHKYCARVRNLLYFKLSGQEATILPSREVVNNIKIKQRELE